MAEKRVKLQKQKAYEYEGHPIFKFRLNMPTDMVKELGWDKDSIELNYFREQMGFEGKQTPAQAAGIKIEVKNKILAVIQNASMQN